MPYWLGPEEERVALRNTAPTHWFDPPVIVQVGVVPLHAPAHCTKDQPRAVSGVAVSITVAWPDGYWVQPCASPQAVPFTPQLTSPSAEVTVPPAGRATFRYQDSPAMAALARTAARSRGRSGAPPPEQPRASAPATSAEHTTRSAGLLFLAAIVSPPTAARAPRQPDFTNGAYRILPTTVGEPNAPFSGQGANRLKRGRFGSDVASTSRTCVFRRARSFPGGRVR